MSELFKYASELIKRQKLNAFTKTAASQLQKALSDFETGRASRREVEQKLRNFTRRAEFISQGGLERYYMVQEIKTSIERILKQLEKSKTSIERSLKQVDDKSIVPEKGRKKTGNRNRLTSARSPGVLFDTDLPTETKFSDFDQLPADELSKWHTWRPLRGKKFERFIHHICTLNGIQASLTDHNDQGVDLIVVCEDCQFAVQIKGIKDDTVGNSAVQQVVAGTAHYRCGHAMVITNSRLTKQAHKLAHSNNCKLIDKHNIAEFIRAPHKFFVP